MCASVEDLVSRNVSIQLDNLSSDYTACVRSRENSISSYSFDPFLTSIVIVVGLVDITIYEPVRRTVVHSSERDKAVLVLPGRYSSRIIGRFSIPDDGYHRPIVHLNDIFLVRFASTNRSQKSAFWTHIMN